MTIETKFLGVAPRGLVERSAKVVENIIVVLANGYVMYQMFEGVSHYSGDVSYDRVTLQ